jgi:ABC-type uncharacterized transport system involved in gliding motility auxiliary subunit
VKDILRFSKKPAKHINRLLRRIKKLINVKATSTAVLTGNSYIKFFRNVRPDVRDQTYAVKDKALLLNKGQYFSQRQFAINSDNTMLLLADLKQ